MTAAHVRQAMVLAAGRGERLRPLTDTCPKPLVTIGDRPLIIHQLSRLAHAGFERVVINLGWLGEQIPKAVAPWLSNAPLNQLEIHYSQEPPGALETAGGIRHALDFFEPGALAVISADVWCEFDYRQLTMHALKKISASCFGKKPTPSSPWRLRFGWRSSAIGRPRHRTHVDLQWHGHFLYRPVCNVKPRTSTPASSARTSH